MVTNLWAKGEHISLMVLYWHFYAGSGSWCPWRRWGKWGRGCWWRPGGDWACMMCKEGASLWNRHDGILVWTICSSIAQQSLQRTTRSRRGFYMWFHNQYASWYILSSNWCSRLQESSFTWDWKWWYHWLDAEIGHAHPSSIHTKIHSGFW